MLMGQRLPVLYSATAEVIIDPRRANVIGFEAVLSGLPSADPAVVESEMRYVASRDLARRVFDDLRLGNSADFRAEFPDAAQRARAMLTQLFEEASTWVANSISDIGMAGETAARAVEASTPLQPGEPPFPGLKQLKVAQVGHSYVMAVTYSSRDPDTATAVANAVVEAYVQDQVERKRMATTKATDWLRGRVASLKSDLAKTEAAAQDYRASHGLVGNRQTDINDEQVAALGRQLTAAETELGNRQARLALIEELRAHHQPVDTLPEFAGSPMILQLRQQESDLARTAADLGTSLGAKHPQMRVITAALANVGGKIVAEVDRLVANLKSEVDASARNVEAVRASLKEAQDRTNQEQADEIGVIALDRDTDAKRALYQEFERRLKETSEQEGIVEADARVIAHAGPAQRTSPPPLLFAVMGFCLSSAFGTMLVFTLDRLDRGLRSENDVRRALDLPRLGLVPLLRLRRERPHRYMLRQRLSVYTEGIRGILAAVAGRRDAPKVVMLASSMPDEGKTTLAIALSLYAASIGRRVLLVDLDLRHPSVARELSLHSGVGILGYLLDDAPLSEAVVRHADPRLDVLVPRNGVGDPMALLAGPSLEALLIEARQNYELVVLDTPPVLGVTDAQLVASLVDTVLFVSRWAKTSRQLAKNAVDLLHRAGANISGIVLNKVDLAKHERYGFDDLGTGYLHYTKYYKD